MSTNNYHILWLDDDFREPFDDKQGKDLSVYPKNARIREMQSAIKEATEAGFIVDTAQDFDEFSEKIQSGVVFHAVIFDLKELNPVDSTDNYGMPNAYELVKDKPLSFYVCSNTPDMPEFEFLKRDSRFINQFNGRIFDKRHRADLFQKITCDLNNRLHYYNTYSYCLEVLSKGYIIGDDEHKAMDNILMHFSEPEQDYCPYNDIRKILECLFRQMLKIKEVPSDGGSMDPVDIMKYICDCGKKGIPPKYPFEKCPQEIKNTLQFLWYISNYYSHSLEKSPDYLQVNETAAEYNCFIQIATYQAFFVSMKWYASRRNIISEEQKELINGIVLTIEKTDIRYLYSGAYQIQINNNYPKIGEGDRIIVYARTYNTGPEKDLYKFFVYHNMYKVFNETQVDI